MAYKSLRDFIQQLEAEPTLHLGQHLHRQGGAAGRGQPQLAGVEPARIRHGEQSDIHGRHAQEHRHAVGGHDPQCLFGIELQVAPGVHEQVAEYLYPGTVGRYDVYAVYAGVFDCLGGLAAYYFSLSGKYLAGAGSYDVLRRSKV